MLGGIIWPATLWSAQPLCLTTLCIHHTLQPSYASLLQVALHVPGYLRQPGLPLLITHDNLAFADHGNARLQKASDGCAVDNMSLAIPVHHHCNAIHLELQRYAQLDASALAQPLCSCPLLAMAGSILSAWFPPECSADGAPLT